jgi:hypothetical protein
MTENSQITVVSGLPRSGTSLMMQMLDSGGIAVVTDHLRTADVDNPRGYFELEKVKMIRDDSSWLPSARGKAFKMVSQLLYDLPATENYRVIFMRRNLEEVLASQDKMLRRSSRESQPHEQMTQAFTMHLKNLDSWFARQPNFRVLYVSYNDLVRQPEREATRVSIFLDSQLDLTSMVRAVDSRLYRNRT